MGAFKWGRERPSATRLWSAHVQQLPENSLCCSEPSSELAEGTRGMGLLPLRRRVTYGCPALGSCPLNLLLISGSLDLEENGGDEKCGRPLETHIWENPRGDLGSMLSPRPVESVPRVAAHLPGDAALWKLTHAEPRSAHQLYSGRQTKEAPQEARALSRDTSWHFIPDDVAQVGLFASGPRGIGKPVCCNLGRWTSSAEWLLRASSQGNWVV